MRYKEFSTWENLPESSGIYIIECIVNSKFYIGSSINLMKRRGEHIKRLKSNSHHNHILQKDFNDFGKDKFKMYLIEEVDEEKMLSREQFYIQSLDATNDGYNIFSTTDMSHQNKKVDKLDYYTGEVIETYESIRIAGHSNNLNENYISSCLNKCQNSCGGYRWAFSGEKFDFTDIKFTDVERINLETGEVEATYKSSAKAELDLGIKIGSSSIRRCISGKYKNANGYYWRRFEKNPERTLYLGYDPGTQGSIVLINPERNTVWKAPNYKIGSEYDIPRIIDYVRHHAKYIKMAVIEDVHKLPKPMSSADWSLSRSKAILEVICHCFNIPFTMVNPKEWQKETWQGVPVQKKKVKATKTITNKLTGKKEKVEYMKEKVLTKETSLLACQRLFPDVDLRDPNRKTDRAKNAHDGVVDALLMALYAKRKF